MIARLPSRDASELDWLAFEQHGVLATRQAYRLLNEGIVRSRVRTGRWRSICRGVLLTGNGQLTRDQQLWVAVLVAGPGAVLAGATAAAEGGVRGLRREPLHVLVPSSRRPGRSLLRRLPLDMPGVVIHRTRVLPEQHLQAARPTRTTMARALIDGAGWAGTPREAQALLASACQQGKVRPGEIREMLGVLPRAPRRPLIRRTVDDIAGGAQALSEIDFIRLCRRHHLPRPNLQKHRTDAGGRTRWLDAYWHEWRLQVEIDGAHHMDVRQWAADMLRQNDVWTAGDRILRFPAWFVRAHPDRVVTAVRNALRAAGWRPE
ncbi:endonuclease domain-containing protein [Plantactinospora sp. GCM10030261]|uniref:endonuclease domain-containing protein n=1 Tax=Plantactinospora sp. GCM10030261 TaxID=3273420 RepID=UPI003606065D